MIKFKKILEFLTKKSCSSFNRALKRKGKAIIINKRKNCRVFSAKILKKTERIRLNKIRKEPKIRIKPSFLPRILISKRFGEILTNKKL
jgi:hypothetical protein